MGSFTQFICEARPQQLCFHSLNHGCVLHLGLFFFNVDFNLNFFIFRHPGCTPGYTLSGFYVAVVATSVRIVNSVDTSKTH